MRKGEQLPWIVSDELWERIEPLLLIVRWLHRFGWRRQEPWELGGSVGDSPTLAHAGCSAVYAASAFRVVMRRIVPHLDI
jgi:hypothetical protein